MSRPFHAASGALTFAHQAVELGLGTGVIGQAQLGFPAAVAASLVMDIGWVAGALRRRPPDAALAFGAGVAVGVPFIHFTLWPWAVRKGVPLLTEAEGLPSTTMGLYNGILYAWAAAGLLAAAVDTPRRFRSVVPLGFLAVLGFRPIAQRHFAWIAREGSRNPQWWNRAWARTS
jgi:hypothetical protein